MIRWCLDRNFVVIPKSVKEQRIIENSDVYDFKLTQEDLQTMVDIPLYSVLICIFICIKDPLKSEELVLAWNPLASPWQPE